MVKRFFEGKSVITHLSEDEALTKDEWSMVEELLQILKWCNNTTIGLQYEELVVGDAYKFWQTYTMQLKKMKTGKYQLLINMT